MISELLILAVLILLNAFFAASEIALISLNDNKIKMMSEQGHKKAKQLYNLLREPSRFLATIQIGITLAGFLASAFAAESFAAKLGHILSESGVPFPEEWLENISVILITLVLSYFTLVLGELVPKRLAMKKPEPIAMFAVGTLTVLSKITSPFVKLLTLSTNILVRMFGVNPHADEERVTEEEIRMMVDVGKEKGTIQEDEGIMIDNIFEFDNKSVSDVMTHRTNVIGISVGSTLDEVTSLINIEKYTRYPVYQGYLDQIVGILHVKDVLEFMVEGTRDEFDIMVLIREPHIVPASKRMDVCFKYMQKNKVHMAVVLDEYGGTAGIVTVEDLLEEIVGNILDEYDEEENEPIEQLDENTYLIQGNASLYKTSEALGIELPIEEFETIGGFLANQLGRIPEPDEHPLIELNGIVFKIEEVTEKRILSLKAYRSE